MPTEVVHTVGSSGGDYTTLGAWEVAQARDLVAANQIAVAEIMDVRGYTSSYTFLNSAAWVTSGECRVIVRAHAASRHDGVFSTATAGIKVSGSGKLTGHATRHHTFEGLCFEGARTSDGDLIEVGRNSHFKACIFKNTNTACQNRVLTPWVGASGEQITFENCIFDANGSAKESFRINFGSGTIYALRMYNNIFANCTGTAVGRTQLDHVNQNSHWRNNLFFDNGTDLHANCNFSLFNHNATSKAAFGLRESGNSANYGAQNRVSQTFSFADAAVGNFRLTSTDAGALGRGDDLSAVMAAKDIVGTTRPQGGAWDIGAFEYSDGGGPGPEPEEISGSLAVTMGGCALVATGSVAVSGQAAAVLGGCSLVATGMTVSAPAQLEDCMLAADGTVSVHGAVTVQLDDCLFLSMGAVDISGQVVVALDDCALVATLRHGIFGIKIPGEAAEAASQVNISVAVVEAVPVNIRKNFWHT